jgi:hypothetical protein
MEPVAGQRYIHTVALDFDPFYPAIEVWVPPGGERTTGFVIGEFACTMADAPRNCFVHSSIASSSSPLETVMLDGAIVHRAWTLVTLEERMRAQRRVLFNEIVGPTDAIGLVEGKRQFWKSDDADLITPTRSTAFIARRWVNGVERDIARCYRLVGNRMLVVLLADNSEHECDRAQLADLLAQHVAMLETTTS